MLPDIAEAVGDKLTLILDSGVRRGSDIVKALALGAKAVLTGRATLYGTAVEKPEPLAARGVAEPLPLRSGQHDQARRAVAGSRPDHPEGRAQLSRVVHQARRDRRVARGAEDDLPSVGRWRVLQAQHIPGDRVLAGAGWRAQQEHQ